MAGQTTTFLDIAETYGKARIKLAVKVVRVILVIYRSLKRISNIFDQDDAMVLAESCSFRPGQRGGPPTCTGGVADFASNDGSRRLLEQAREMENAFPTYDSSGHPVSPAHRWLACTAVFRTPDCTGSCSCSGRTAIAKCRARKLKCKGELSFDLSLLVAQKHVYSSPASTSRPKHGRIKYSFQ